MESDVTSLIDLFVAAFSPTAEARLQRAGLAAPPGWAAALAEGERWLRRELEALLGLPHREQARSPLEVFQEAMRFPTDALAAAGTPPVDRDEGAVAALPGDLYGLAPASSQDLGQEAWQAHVAWGISRARHLRPVVLWAGTDLMDRSRIEAVVTGHGMTLHRWPDEEDRGGRPLLALVDLRAPRARDAIATLAGRHIRTVAYGPHVDGEALEDALRLGAAVALARSKFFSRLPALLPTRV